MILRGRAKSADGGERIEVEAAGSGLVDSPLQAGKGERRVGGESGR